MPKLARPATAGNTHGRRNERRRTHPHDWMKSLPGVFTGIAMVIGAVTGLLRLFL